jgi:carbonic anhydrase/acetyltransferase-like protein (isoleucine patch superfamily)
MPLVPCKGVYPRVPEDVFIAEGAIIIGDVTIGSGSTIGMNAVIRGDVGPVVLGEGVVVGDNCFIDSEPGCVTSLGNGVSVGAGAVIHAAHIGNTVLIGENCVILTGAKIGNNCVVGSHSVIQEERSIPSGSVVAGEPARVVRPITDQEIAWIRGLTLESARRVHETFLGVQEGWKIT